MKTIVLVASIFVLGLTGCMNRELKDLMTPGSELNNYYASKAPTTNQTPKSEGPSPWTESRSDAMTWAENSGRVILANFTGSDWCRWCKRLESEVFETEEFRIWADENAVLLRLEYPKDTTTQPPALKAQNTQLRQIYNQYISGYPTVLFLDSEGKVLGRLGHIEGGPKAWIAAAEQQIGHRRRR